MAEYAREKRFKTRSPGGTFAIAGTLAEILAAPRVVLLSGPLGAGKTTLVKGWAEALGVAKADDVTSPTFTLIHEYASPRVTLYHLDVYRLDSERELLALGLDEMAASPGALLLIEWGERFESLRGLANATVEIMPLEGEERSFHVRWN